jgi:hypothetical protein
MEKIRKNRMKAITISLILLLTFSAILVALPIVGAHDPPLTVPTHCSISVRNNPIGVNQEELIVFWLNGPPPPTASGAYGDRWTYTVEVTKPDGSKETLGPFTSDPVGGGWTSYTPTQVGTYTFVAKFAEHKITGEPFPPGWGPFSSGYDAVNDTYLGDTSDPYYLTVQEEPIEAWSETPLPTEYWERPINSANREWYALAGNWLAGAAQNVGPTSNFNYGLGPESAHVMWTREMWAGGIMDARFGSIGYQTSHYEGIEFFPPIILNGKLYYNVLSLPREGWYCVDLYTGETEYFHNTTGPVMGAGGYGGWSSGSITGESLSFGQIYNYESPNQHGGMPYLWSTGALVLGAPGTPVGPLDTWMMFDAFTGNYMCSIKNVPVIMSPFGMSYWGTQVYGKDGSILMYNTVNLGTPAAPNYYLQCWNTSQAIWYKPTWDMIEYWLWRPVLNMTYDGNNGYSLNVSIPAVSGSILAVREGEFVIGGTSGTNKVDEPLVMGNLWCLSLEPGKEGTLLWNRTFTPPYDEVPSTIGGGMFGSAGVSMGRVDPEDGVFLFSSAITRERWGYSLDTMEMLWGPTEPESQMNYYGMNENIYQGKLLSYGYGGELIAYNITTGEVLWTYEASNVGYESPFGNYPINLACIADGKIYLSITEHSPTQPLYRGPNLRCINASNGAELWKILYFGGPPFSGNTVVVADGFIVALNFFDNQIYCFGKGLTETTVTAPEAVQPLGTSILIKGTITDQSPGETCLGIPAEGTPAIADEYMSEWMEYLYMQQPKPTDAEGVEVMLTTLDPNGNTYEISRTTSSDRGTFGCEVDLPVPGLYKIIATFEGSDSYYGSSAETYLIVEEAPAAAQPIEPEPTEPVPTEPEPTEAEPTEPEPTEPEPTEPEPTEPEPAEPAEAPLFSTTDLAIIAAVVVAVVIGVAAYWKLRKQK